MMDCIFRRMLIEYHCWSIVPREEAIPEPDIWKRLLPYHEV